MRNRINAGGRRNRSRHRDRECRIENRHRTRRFRIAARHFHMSFCVGDHGKRLCFTAGPGSRGHGNHRQHGFGGFADSVVVPHATAIGQQKVGSFCAVHAAAAAESHDEFTPGSRWANATQRSTSSVVGFGATSPKTATFNPAACSEATAVSQCPAAFSPGSVTSRIRSLPKSRVICPNCKKHPAPKMTRVRGW